MSKFKVGDKVTVIDTGKTFSSYKDWMLKNGFAHLDKWVDGYSPISFMEGVIVEIAIHSKFRDSDIICLVKDMYNQRVYMIGETGLELNEFTYKDIKENDKLTFKNGEIETVYDGGGEHLETDRIYVDEYEFKNIVKVERPTDYETIYVKEEEIKEMTLKEICDKLGYTVKIVKEDK